MFGVRVGKMSDFKQSWKILPFRVGKIMITERKKSNLANFSTPTLTSNFGKK